MSDDPKPVHDRGVLIPLPDRGFLGPVVDPRDAIEAERAAATRKAQTLFGAGAIVGYNEQYQDRPCFVGKKIRGAFVQFGAGASWDAAFAAVKDVVDLGNGRFKTK